MNEEGSPTIPRACSSSGTERSDFTDLVDLAAERLGGSVLIANDEFFAPKENLLKAGEAVWKEGVYTDVGKWMDGWETRRRREPGHDWCIVRLGLPGTLRGVIVDTAHFRGNYPESCSLEVADATHLSGSTPGSGMAELVEATGIWRETLPRTRLQPHTRHFFEAELLPAGPATHARFRIFPDGGVGRLRLLGTLA